MGRVLVACEFSGVVRRAFRAAGHQAWSCDLLPAEDGAPHHIQGDALTVAVCGSWDLMIAHPPCTYLSRAGARWWKQPGRDALAAQAATFVMGLFEAPILRVCIENPRGQLNQRWRYPDQTIQPWEFGHPYSKATCFWLKNLPPLMPTALVGSHEPLLPSNTGRGARKGQRTHKGHTRSAKEASRTFQGVADAMAAQWGAVLEKEQAA